MASNKLSDLTSPTADLKSPSSLCASASGRHPGDSGSGLSSSQQSHFTSVQTDTLLHDRVAALEAELARAMSDKLSIEGCVQSVYQFPYQSKAENVANGSAIEEAAKLRTDLRILKRENKRLKAKLFEAHASQVSIVKTFCSVLNSSGSERQTLRGSQDGGLLDRVICGALRDGDKSTSTTAASPSGPDASTDSDIDLLELFSLQPCLKLDKQAIVEHPKELYVNDVVMLQGGQRPEQPSYVHYFADTAQPRQGSIMPIMQSASEGVSAI